jgi:serine/threonine protein kinase/DNA-binding NarL/FixJ family response regulator/tetratricopeptide (TPR) repeat protein
LNSAQVLIVEDNQDYRRLLEITMREAGFAVRSVGTAAEAIEKVLIEKPAILLLDLTLPGMSGEELCRVIKEDPFLRDIVIMVVTATSDQEKKLNLFAAGINDYLVKPVDTRELVARARGFQRFIEMWKPPSAESQHALEIPGNMLQQKDKSHPTVDFIGGPSASDSAVKIRPKYGVYRVESLIGSGAMGHVFKAYDEPLERFVAIKILSKKLSSAPAFVERFRREAKVLAAINHPGIAFIYSFGEEEGEHYFAIQWCSNGSVADLIKKKQRIDILPSLDILLQSAKALEAASKKGIVHRDIKPSNILFDENQQVKIVDFGLAFSEKMNVRITQVQELLGTPSFMAPEQAQNASVDHRADIYSLGITFYYMLYGKLPFTAASAIEMVIKHASQTFPMFDSLDNRIPRQAYDIITRMTGKNPEDRYFDYATLIQDLEKLRNDLLSQAEWKLPKATNIAPVPNIISQNLFELIWSVFSENLTGVLTVRWSALQKRFLIRQREIVAFESSQPDEKIWNSMVHKGLLQKEEVPPNSEDMETSLTRFLLNQTFTMADFKSSYHDLMKAALMQVFFWPVFEGEFATASIVQDAFAPVRLSEVMLEASRTFLTYDQIHKELPQDQWISRGQLFESTLSTLNLKPEESFIASRLEGEDTNIATLQLLTGLPEETIGRFVFSLMKMGAVQFRQSTEKRAPRRQEPAPAAAAGASASQPVQPQVQQPPPQAEVPVQTKKSRTSESDSELLERIGAVRRFVHQDEDKTSREDLDRGKQQVRLEVLKSDKIVEIEHHVRMAEQFYRLAEEKFETGDYWNVAQLCKQAIKNYPVEPKYYNLMAKAYAQHPKFGKDAEQCFYKALEMDPWNPDYHVDLARFYFSNGLSKRALAQCQKAVKLAPQHDGAKMLMSELARSEKG